MVYSKSLGPYFFLLLAGFCIPNVQFMLKLPLFLQMNILRLNFPPRALAQNPNLGSALKPNHICRQRFIGSQTYKSTWELTDSGPTENQI